MPIVYPVQLDDPVSLIFPDGSCRKTAQITESDLSSDCDFKQMSGRDSSDANNMQGRRVTNLVGIKNQSLMKKCPHCNEVFPYSSFGPLGRETNENRDQSNCSNCRSRYGD